MAFAAATKVPIDKTRLEIERTMARYGATHFATFSEPERAMIAFRIKDRNIRFTLALPAKMGDQARRSRWRALLLVIKAKLESVESQIETLEEAFLPHIVMPGGQTVYEQIKSPIAVGYENNSNVPLLPGAAPVTTLAFKKPVISDLAAEAMALDVWHGRTIYADFLREHNRRPDPAQAAAIGKIMGTRVRASDGSMQPKPASRRR